MNLNPPAELPQYVTHKAFFSQVLNHELGYNIYLSLGTGCDEISVRTTFTDGRVMNLPRYGSWNRSINKEIKLNRN